MVVHIDCNNSHVAQELQVAKGADLGFFLKFENRGWEPDAFFATRLETGSRREAEGRGGDGTQGEEGRGSIRGGARSSLDVRTDEGWAGGM